jgi:hypothetical protein
MSGHSDPFCRTLSLCDLVEALADSLAPIEIQEDFDEKLECWAPLRGLFLRGSLQRPEEIDRKANEETLNCITAKRDLNS